MANYRYIFAAEGISQVETTMPVEVTSTFTDNCNMAILPFDRPGMKELIAQLEPGDHIYMDKANMISNNAVQYFNFLKHCKEHDVSVFQLHPTLLNLTKVLHL